MNDSTPYPGHLIGKDDATSILKKFKSKFRAELYTDMPNNVPTACTLQGEKVSEKYLFNNLIKLKNIYVVIESPDELLSSTGGEFIDFYKNRQPWEDYDICIFDSSFDWCFGITHDDAIIVVNSEDQRGQGPKGG